MPANDAAQVPAAEPAEPNLEQAVPFFMVADMAASLGFYVDGLAFTIQNKWTPRGEIEWCMLARDGVRLMLQAVGGERREGWRNAGAVERGIIIFVFCRDALAIYREAKAAGLAPQTPVVGNAMWVTAFTDPDGYRIEFESPTDAPEESVYSGKA